MQQLLEKRDKLQNLLKVTSAELEQQNHRWYYLQVATTNILPLLSVD